MTRERCEYCGQEERYGHNVLCVMNTVEELRAEVERLMAENKELWKGQIIRLRQTERLTALALKFLNEQTDENAAALRAALEPKP